MLDATKKKKKVDISHQRSLHLAEGMSHIEGDLKKKKKMLRTNLKREMPKHACICSKYKL